MTMKPESSISADEIRYLRELAGRYAEYAELPVMRDREALWYAHNSLEGSRPPVIMEIDSFLDDLLPECRCTHPFAMEMERYLQAGITNHELVDDDKVISGWYEVPLSISTDTYGMDIGVQYSPDEKGRLIGFAYDHPIRDLETDLGKLRPSRYQLNQEETDLRKRVAEDAFGEILPVRITNRSLDWFVAPSKQVVELMGMERMMFDIMDHPKLIHELYAFLTADMKAFMRWQEEQSLLLPNNGNNYVGSGSYGFTRELPGDRKDTITSGDLWGNMNSQETVGISPQMFEEFIYPYYRELAAEFGLVYFGCCEPVHDIWKNCISNLPNLRKVSISAWCDEEFMGEALKGSNVIYSRKPSPNFIGVGRLDDEAFSEHIAHTLSCARGCSAEIIFRDIYTLDGDTSKPGRAVAIVRKLIEEYWG